MDLTFNSAEFRSGRSPVYRSHSSWRRMWPRRWPKPTLPIELWPRSAVSERTLPTLTGAADGGAGEGPGGQQRFVVGMGVEGHQRVRHRSSVPEGDAGSARGARR